MPNKYRWEALARLILGTIWFLIATPLVWGIWFPIAAFVSLLDIIYQLLFDAEGVGGVNAMMSVFGWWTDQIEWLLTGEDDPNWFPYV